MVGVLIGARLRPSATGDAVARWRAASFLLDAVGAAVAAAVAAAGVLPAAGASSAAKPDLGVCSGCPSPTQRLVAPAHEGGP
ncbi:hypothetical protein HK405_007115, partial [Cladochytrium tenue]